MSSFWANETARQAEAGNPLYGGESRDWSTTMKSLTYGEIEARLNAVIALCDATKHPVCAYDHIDATLVRAAATGVTP